MNSSRILSRFFKQTWRGYSAGKGMYQPAGRPQSATARYFEYLQSPAGKKGMLRCLYKTFCMP
ncbi:Transmembrane protein 177 [Caligus rogercresseyi]|uniref:Transmembrane protein 177 n=1 Tax=Caligus rogercresseyi TaxID=217165 RepID=A0A7T8JWV1_CALRO|nr:Transmembrane protein 177 [Caligus rogercresseyi]